MFDPFRSLARLNRLDIVPQLSELPHRPGTERAGRLFPNQFVENIDDTAKLLAITVRCDDFSLCFG